MTASKTRCWYATLYVSARTESGGGERLTFSIDADEHAAELRVCELTPESAERLVAEACLPLVGNVLEQVAERVTVRPDRAGAGAQLAISLSAR